MSPIAQPHLAYGDKNIIIWSPVLYTGSFKPNHATDLLHEMVDFKNQQNFTAVLVKQKKQVKHNTILHTLQLSVKIKETPRAFTAVGVLTTHLKTTKTRTLRYDQ